MRRVCESCGAATNKGNALCCKCAHPNLSPEERSARAKESARARWGEPRARSPGYISPCRRDGDYIPPSRRGICSRCGRIIQIGRDSRADPVCHPCRRAAPAVMFEYVCPVCGREFTSPYSVQTCSRRCGGMVAAWKMLRPGLPFDREEMAAICDRRKMRGKTQSRARQLRHAQTWDGISDEEILERDGWRCQIPGCKRRPIRKDAAYPHPRSPSVDHIIPLSLGGDDTAVNKRAAHLVCNVARGNRVGVEQLPLFGVVREPPLATVTAGERAAMFQRPERKHLPSRTVCFPNCAHCGKLFTAHTRRAKFCSLKCRNASRFQPRY